MGGVRECRQFRNLVSSGMLQIAQNKNLTFTI